MPLKQRNQTETSSEAPILEFAQSAGEGAVKYTDITSAGE